MNLTALHEGAVPEHVGKGFAEALATIDETHELVSIGRCPGGRPTRFVRSPSNDWFPAGNTVSPAMCLPLTAVQA